MSTKTKKTLTKVASIATSGATILWLSGVSMLMPAMAATYANGTLLKGSTGDVWVVNNNLKSPVRSIEVFTNSGYDWSAVKTVSDSALNAVSTATLIKTADNPDVYRLEKNFTRKLASIEIFNSYSLDWNKISVVSQPVMDSFSYAPIYQYGADLFWRDASNVLHQFPTMDLFTGNGYNVRDLIVVNVNEYGSFAVGGQITSAPTTPVTPVTGALSVALAADTPVSATLANDTALGSAAADLAHFTFTNGSGADIKVTQLKVKRLGVSGDSTVGNLYLFDGYTRLTDEATFSTGVASFNDASGIFTVPANGSKTIAVRGDIAAAMSGQTIGMSLNAATDVVSNAASVSGSFPMNGNLLSIVDSTDVADATFGAVTPGANAALDAQNEFTAWTATLAVTNQDENLEMIRFTQIGSISAGDFNNIKLRINNVDTATGQLVTGKTGQDLVFDLHSSPIEFKKGVTKTISVVGDIVGGTSKTLRIGIDKKVDVMLKDKGYGNYTLVTFSGGGTTARAGLQTIATGTITMTKRTDSPTSNITVGATNQSFAKFDIKANGEEIKINTLKVQAYMSATTTTTAYLKNVSLYLDGVQVGNTANIQVTAGASNVTQYTSFSIYQKIAAATTKTLEVKGDVYTCAASACTANIAAANDKIQIKILGSADEDNAQGMISAASIDAPGSTASANELTVGTGTLTLYKNTAYSDQTVSSGGNIKIGSYNLQANAYDKVNITGFTVAYVNQVGTIATTKWSNMYVVYGGTTSTVKGTMTSSNTFSVNTSLAANTSMQIDVYATLDSSVTSGSASTTLAVTATKATDGSDASASAQVGQNVTVATASRSVAIDTTIPSALVVGGTNNVEIMDVRFKSLSAPSTIDQMRLKIDAGDSDYDSLVNCKLNYPTEGGTAETASQPFINSGGTYYATFTGLTMALPANLDKTVKVYCSFNYVGTGYADTGDYPTVNLYDYRVTSGGTQSTETPSSITSQAMVLRKSKPVVAANALSSTYLTAGSGITIAKFTITPDAAGAIGWTRLVLQYASSTNVQLTTGSDYIKVWNENTGQQVTASTSVATAIDYVNKDITFTAATEQIIGSATTYTLRADIGGTLATGDYLSVYIKNGNSADTIPTNQTSYAGAAADDSIVWTDRSNDSHTVNTSDWTCDWLVKTIGSGYGWQMTR
ncbi:MAG: hypothetical protein HY813_03240 [Candidatus Portnoybacteria bacterium]|nr:hypothetical protein [Candidatus Portnoybacteria bacterium]